METEKKMYFETLRARNVVSLCQAHQFIDGVFLPLHPYTLYWMEIESKAQNCIGS
jgi:hypothetical protein